MVTAVVVVLFVPSGVVHTVHFEHLKIRGTRAFTGRVVDVLTLLKTKSPSAYETVTNHIGVIVQAQLSGMAAYETPPTAKLRAPPAWESTTSFASGIAHEAIHSKLYHDYQKQLCGLGVVPDGIWSGEAAEKQCCEYQTRVLQDIGAPASEITYYTWNPSNRYWEVPYEKRNW